MGTRHVFNNTQESISRVLSHLKSNTSIQNRISNLCHGTSHKKTGRNNTNHGSKWKDGLNKVGEELIGCHSNSNGGKDNLIKFGIVNWENHVKNEMKSHDAIKQVVTLD